MEHLNKYILDENERLISLEELLKDIESIDRTKLMINEHIEQTEEEVKNEKVQYGLNSLKLAKNILDERVKASMLAIKEISNFFLENPNVNEVFKVKFNNQDDELKEYFPDGRYEMDITNKNLDLMKIDDKIEICNIESYNLGHLRKHLWNFS
jgi:hypothetical protein